MTVTPEFAKPLILTTPHLHGQNVRDAQWLLAGHNRFAGLATYKDGPVDGDYGPLTATATARARYWLGYPTAKQTAVFDQTLYEYLRVEKWRPLPKTYQAARDARLAAAAETPGRKAMELAATFLGYHESPPGSNDQQFGAWYGFNGVPWCAIFESYCFAHTGHPAYRYAAVESIYYDAVAGRNGLRTIATPQQGDVVLYSLNGERFAHTAFYDHKITDTRFADLGGNTGPASESNGGMVARGERDTSTVLAFVRVA
jgi:hypothetical protein